MVELTPGALEGTPGLLQARGYLIRQFQQVWHRPLAAFPRLPTLPGVLIRLLAPGEEGLFDRVVMAGFLDQDGYASLPEDQLLRLGEGSRTRRLLAFVDGEPAGGGSVGLVGPVATLAGTSVLPRFRGRGLQRNLIEARLRLAAEWGSVEICSATLPVSASHHSLVGMGFQVAYPKLELAKP